MKRVPCLVPGCRCTVKLKHESDNEGICQKHWALVRRDRRRVYARARRKGFVKIAANIWARLKAEAIERSFGL